MTLAGWLFMSLSIGFVVALVAFCFYRVLTRPVAERGDPKPLDRDPDAAP